MEIDFYRDLMYKSMQLDWPVKYIHHDQGDPELSFLSLRNHYHPFSIKLREFEYLKNFTRVNKLRNGFEVATGTGISCIAPALGGINKIVSMDAFIEENRAHSHAYLEESKITYQDASGYKSARQLAKYFELDNVINEVGWSPDDTGSIIEKHFSEPLQYVFIDALHTTEAVLKDLKAVEPYIDRSKYAIFLHDTHAFDDRLNQYFRETYKQEYTICPGCSVDEGCWHLSVVTNQ